MIRSPQETCPVSLLNDTASIAGVSVGQMMAILTEFGVESRIEQDDYLRSLDNLATL